MNAQANLFGHPRKRKPRIILGNQHHEAVDPKLDRPRLLTQYEKILGYMKQKGWVTQYEIADALGIPQGSVGSQIRNARVEGWNIDKRRRAGKGTWEYILGELKLDPNL